MLDEICQDPFHKLSIYSAGMSVDMLYSGDDIGALVFDAGHYSLRVGHALDSVPKAEIPAVVGVCEGRESFSCFSENEEWMGQKSSVYPYSNIETKFYVDTNYVHVAREGMEAMQYMKDGMIDNWDLFEKVLDYSYEKIILSESHLHPVLMSEASWNETERREKLTEIMFEKYKVPAFFLAKNSVLAAFANGRTSGIVLDSGASHTSAVPIEDGFVVKKAIVKTPFGGDFITALCEEFLKNKVGVDIVPPYLVASKEAVKQREKSLWTRKKHQPEVTKSWLEYMKWKVIQDFQISILQICETPFDAKVMTAVPSAHYEFPDGYHQEFGAERFGIPEALFVPNASPAAENAGSGSGSGGETLLGAAEAVAASARLCDAESRQALCANVIVTGGNSLLQGFAERLARELQARAGGGAAAGGGAGGASGGGGGGGGGARQQKVVAARGAAERRFAAWLGGSIVASLATCRRMWLSAHEYADAGKAHVARKCP